MNTVGLPLGARGSAGVSRLSTDIQLRNLCENSSIQAFTHLLITAPQFVISNRYPGEQEQSFPLPL